MKNSCYKFQSYDRKTFAENIKICSPISCLLQKKCNMNEYNHQKYILYQQNLYAKMRRQPELFPIIPSVKNKNLTLQQQRTYSNLWYRQFGTSQALPVNSTTFGASYICGSEVPYTN
jgi:hypothetical protein